MNILVVDDEENIVELIKFNLELKEYNVDTASDGNEALEKINNTKYDFILLDVMLPYVNGLSILKKTRQDSINKDTLILMLSAKAEENDIILALEIGADGYLTKPFSVNELQARIKSLHRMSKRNSPTSTSSILSTGPFSLNLKSRTFKINNEEKNLTKKEFDLMVYFLKNQNTVISREELLKDIWGFSESGETRTVDVHMKNLRSKVEENHKQPKYIHTVVGIGYKFVCNE